MLKNNNKKQASHIACVGTDCATKSQAQAVGGVAEHCSPAIKMNMLATQNRNVFLPLRVVPRFCLRFCSLTRPAMVASSSTRWCFGRFGGLKVSLMSLCKEGR